MTERNYPSDLEIKEVYKKDNKVGFRLMYHKYAERLYAVCRRYSGGEAWAMDYFQEGILRINSKINSSYNYNGEGSLFRWMSTVTVNRILDNLRKQNKLKEIRLEDTGIDMSEDVIDVPEDIPLEDILKMVEELSPAKRTVFNLFIDGFSYKEIAQILRITEYGASSTMSKARKELSMKIDEYYRTK